MEDNYRDKYKNYYNIKFSENYDIHHIDFNRDNNIDNLILLPVDLHKRYHNLLQYFGNMKEPYITLNAMITWKYDSTSEISLLEEYIEILKEITEWTKFKNQLEMNKYN